MNPIHWRYCSYRELQSGADEISVADRFAIVKALKMNDIQEFLIWQRKLLERQMGRSGIDVRPTKASHTPGITPLASRQNSTYCVTD